MSELHVRRNATLLGVSWGRWVEDEDGEMIPHPEYADRHTVEVMLADGDRLPVVSGKSRVTIIFENGETDE